MSGSGVAILVLAVALVGALAALGFVLARMESRRRSFRRHLRAEKIEIADLAGQLQSRLKSIGVAELSPAFRSAPDGDAPGVDAELRFIGGGTLTPGSPSDTETWILSLLARDAHRIFEFGTGSGRTTWALAANSPADARVTTLTLLPSEPGAYQADPGDAALAERNARLESQSAGFFYEGTDEAQKIEQLFEDSKRFDEKPREATCDLIFVDGSHARSYVESDSRKALRMLAPGGVIVWHDFRSRHYEETRGVHEFLRELRREIPLAHVRGTRLVVYRS